MAKTYKFNVSFPMTITVDTEGEQQMAAVFAKAKAALEDPEQRQKALTGGGQKEIQIIDSCDTLEEFFQRCAILEIRGTIRENLHDPKYGMRAGGAKVERVR